MTQDLRSSLEDLVAEGPPRLVPRELAQAAWSQGRRRRRLRLATMTTLVLVLLGVGVGVGVGVDPFHSHSPRFPPADGSGGVGGEPAVGGYPERIGHQWWVRDLPAKPGPLALLMQRVVHHGTYDQFVGWEAVSESGQRWHLAGIFGGNDDYPSLSPDGRKLAYLSGVDGPYVIRDLVSGRVTTFPSVGSAIPRGSSTYSTQGQSPSYWSPDGKHLVLDGFPRDLTHHGRALVLGMDGSVQLEHGRGWPAGWLDASTVVWLTPKTYGGREPVRVTVRIRDLSGTVERSVTLSTPLRPNLGQWAGAVSPDGTEILVLTHESDFNTVFRRFSLADGRPVGPPMPVDYLGSTCAATWRSSTPVIPVLEGDNVYPGALSSTGVKRLIAIEPRVGSECVVWAADALTGTRHGMLFGLSMTPWTWWWRELLLGFLVTGLLIWFWGRWTVVRRRRGS